MALYLITYDLRNPGRDYVSLYDLLGTTWRCARLAESVWVGDLKGPSATIRDLIQAVVDSNDRIFVVEIAPRADWAARHALPAGINIVRQFSP